MNCEKVKRLLPGYLDDAVLTGTWADTHVSIGHHLESLRGLPRGVARLSGHVVDDVQRAASRAAGGSGIADSRRGRATSFRPQLAALCASRADSRRAGSEEYPGTSGHSRDGRLHRRFRRICPGLPVARPRRAAARGSNDSPTNLLQPARLEALAPFPITGLEESGHAGPHALLVEATVNAQGEAVSYRILAGPDTDTVRRQLDLVLLFSRFRPEMSFGRFTSGGRVVLSFSDISIRG